MKFIVDAQLPRRVANWLNEAGHDAIHTLELPAGNRTPDHEINARALREDRAVVTKDTDFVNTHLLYGRPDKLLVISAGNLANDSLAALFLPNIPMIAAAFKTARYLELTRTRLIVHD